MLRSAVWEVPRIVENLHAPRVYKVSADATLLSGGEAHWLKADCAEGIWMSAGVEMVIEMAESEDLAKL